MDLAAVSAITAALVEVVKRSPLSRFTSGWETFIALIVAVLISLSQGIDFISGVLAGLGSMGIYDITKVTTNKVREVM